MINIEQITSRLAKMPDQALQQYAAMHKSDPYIMALAMSESKRRKDLRASAQAGSMQEQPKVVDQALQAMAPQQSPDGAGIAALPTGEMGFADGGIVAFADGGGVDRFNGSQSQFVQDVSRIPQSYEKWWQDNREADRIKAERERAMAQRQQDELAARQKTSFANYLFGSPERAAEGTAELAQLSATPVVPPAAAPVSRPTERMTPQQMEAKVTPAAPTAPAPKPKVEAGLGGTKEAAALRGAPGAGAPSIDEAKKLSGQFLDTKSMRNDLDKFYKDEEAAVAASRKRRDDGKPEGVAYSKYEEMLKSEESGAAKEKDEAIGVAIFKAGLGMMSGTSPHAFENIGKGAMAGLEEYSGAMKDMKKAAKERQKAMADIENARRAESRDDWKTAQSFEEKADARMSKAREFGVKGIMDITGKDAEIASGIYKTQVEQKGRMDVAHVQGGYQLAAANTRTEGRGELTAKDRASIADKAMDNVNATLKANMAMQMKAAKDPSYMQQMIQAETARLMAAAEGRTMASAPGAGSPGGTSNAGWGKAQVVNP